MIDGEQLLLAGGEKDLREFVNRDHGVSNGRKIVRRGDLRNSTATHFPSLAQASARVHIQFTIS
jgi:hypothetical protein